MNDGPHDAVEDYLSPDHPILESEGDAVLLSFRREVILAETVAQQSAEQRFAAAMPDGARGVGGFLVGWIGGPDDVQPRSESHLTESDSRL